jgi:hypothetical protein
MTTIGEKYDSSVIVAVADDKRRHRRTIIGCSEDQTGYGPQTLSALYSRCGVEDVVRDHTAQGAPGTFTLALT